MAKDKRTKEKPGMFAAYDDTQRKIIFLRFMLFGALCAALLSGITIIAYHIFYNNQSTSVSESPSSPMPEENITSTSNITDSNVPVSEDIPLDKSADPISITLSFTGDCTLGTDESFNYSTSLNAYYESHGAEYFLENVRSIFEEDDLTIVNFEGTLTTSNERNENLFAFKGDPSYTSILTSASVEAANIANNHSHDYGEQGFEDTMTNLTNAGITAFGYDTTAVVDVKGVKVGLVGIYELYDHLERTQQLKDNIAKVKSEGAQLIVVVFHWGNEKETTPDSNQITLGRLAIDEGAHVVVGHHSHVIQPVEKYNGRYIAYSMANFCFGGNSAPSDTDTFIFQQTFTITDNQVQQDDNISLIPCSVTSAEGYNNYQPTPVDGDRATSILGRINAPIG